MTRSYPLARLGTAVLTAVAATILVAGIASAHPESEGDHAGSCIVTVEPGSVVAGGSLSVRGSIPGTECGDANAVTVNPALPDTALELPDDTTILAGWIVLLIGIAAVGERVGADHR